MAQQSIKKMAEHMTSMYNNLQAEENENTDRKKEKVQRHQRKKNIVHLKGPSKLMNEKEQLCKQCKKVARHFEKDCFELKDNE